MQTRDACLLQNIYIYIYPLRFYTKLLQDVVISMSGILLANCCVFN